MKYFIMLIALIFSLTELNAQFSIPNIIKEKVEQKAQQEVEKEVDETLNPKEKQKQDKNNDNNDEQSNSANKENAPAKNPDLKSFSKYDFIPGENLYFFDDFSKDVIGDFPALWNTNGSGEVVTLNQFPGAWLKIKAAGYYIPLTKDDFTENYTSEFDFIGQRDNGTNEEYEFGFYIVSGDINDPNEGGAVPGKSGSKINITSHGIDFSSYDEGGYTVNGSKSIEIKTNEKYHLSVWVQKQRLRVYLNEIKVIDAPRALAANKKFNVLRFENYNDLNQPLITNFKVAGSTPDMRNKLISEGKLVSHGIQFDVGSDKLKPESYGALKDIAQVLKDNPAVKIKIVGHTDSDGKDETNLSLSKKRAESVKKFLNSEFKIDGGRMQTDGKGAGEPLSPNDTPQGKANNRRVEFIKL